jgi:hypothetical protein
MIQGRAGSLAHRVRASELGPEQQDLAGVVHPQQEDHHRSGGAVAGGHAALTEIQADELLTDREEHGRHKCTRRHIAPAQMHVQHEAGGAEGSDDRTKPRETRETGDQLGGNNNGPRGRSFRCARLCTSNATWETPAAPAYRTVSSTRFVNSSPAPITGPMYGMNLAALPGWAGPLWVVGLFVVLELRLGKVREG